MFLSYILVLRHTLIVDFPLCIIYSFLPFNTVLVLPGFMRHLQFNQLTRETGPQKLVKCFYHTSLETDVDCGFPFVYECACVSFHNEEEN